MLDVKLFCSRSASAVTRVRSASNVTVIKRNLPRNLRQGKIKKLRVIYAYFKFFQIIKELIIIDVRSELSNFRDG